MVPVRLNKPTRVDKNISAGPLVRKENFVQGTVIFGLIRLVSARK